MVVMVNSLSFRCAGRLSCALVPLLAPALLRALRFVGRRAPSLTDAVRGTTTAASTAALALGQPSSCRPSTAPRDNLQLVCGFGTP